MPIRPPSAKKNVGHNVEIQCKNLGDLFRSPIAMTVAKLERLLSVGHVAVAWHKFMDIFVREVRVSWMDDTEKVDKTVVR